MTIDEALENIKTGLSAHGVEIKTDADLCRFLDLSMTAVQQWRIRGKIPSNMILKLHFAYSIPVEKMAVDIWQ